MIYLFTMLLNEPDLLDLNLAEATASGVVDRIVVAQGEETFTQRPKASLDLRDRWPDVDWLDFPAVDRMSPWQAESLQRDSMYQRVLPGLKGDDVIILVDTDEIILRNKYAGLIEEVRDWGYVRLVMRDHAYYVNYVSDITGFDYIRRPIATTALYLREQGLTPAELRMKRFPHAAEPQMLVGHHFSWVIPPERFAYKLEAFSHWEYNRKPFKDPEYIRPKIAAGEDVFGRARGRVWTPEPINDTYPQHMRENLDKWKDWIHVAP